MTSDDPDEPCRRAPLRLTGDIGAARRAHEDRSIAMAELGIEVPRFRES